jgi:23S rRNA (adenine2030-N6)-methyltransferase
MNYRHHFHAGNFADVAKHVLLTGLLRALQRKEKGFLYADTHAGRGRYDLAAAATGDSQGRTPEWPEGIGRLWDRTGAALPPLVGDYLELVREFDRSAGNLGTGPRFYPGSPAIARRLVRPVDRIALAERHPAEAAVLRNEWAGRPRSSVLEGDGYALLRGWLPPPERRALVLMDPPFEAQDEFAQLAMALRDGLARLPAGVFALWYPLTQRARVDEFLGAVRALSPDSALACELTVVGPASELKLRGCGLLVVNPPWRFELEAGPALGFLAEALSRGPGAEARVDWLVREGAPA